LKVLNLAEGNARALEEEGEVIRESSRESDGTGVRHAFLKELT